MRLTSAYAKRWMLDDLDRRPEVARLFRPTAWHRRRDRRIERATAFLLEVTGTERQRRF